MFFVSCPPDKGGRGVCSDFSEANPPFATETGEPPPLSGGFSDAFLRRSMRNLNRNGLIKLSESSFLRSSIPATASNPKGLPSTLVNLCTSTAGGASDSDFASPVFGGVLIPVVFTGIVGEVFVPSFSSKDFIISAAFATESHISERDVSRVFISLFFQSLVTYHFSSGEFVMASKNASKPEGSFGGVGIRIRNYELKVKRTRSMKVTLVFLYSF